LGQKGLNRTGELLEMKDERETKLKTNAHSFSYTMEGRIKRKTIFLFMHFPMIDLTAYYADVSKMTIPYYPVRNSYRFPVDQLL
jgi:hypothetical protein